ncbi:MAG: hypothetical protein OEX82_04485 [Nitrosomonas sp.]|nr:hypothetical protein [Nitrosomonas sp.]
MTPSQRSNTPEPDLVFADGCSDCAQRTVMLPEQLPNVGDDFDWLIRDYDGFRLFMLEELAARFPERRNWTPADMEVVIVEALSVVLDQLSDMLDRAQSEAFLETARQPESVRRLLAMIGFDAVAFAPDAAAIPDASGYTGETNAEQHNRLQRFHSALRLFMTEYPQAIEEMTAMQQANLNAFVADVDNNEEAVLQAVQLFLDNAPEFVSRARNDALTRYWRSYPYAMDNARSAGPRAIHTQKRMVTTTDYAQRLEDHPLVLNAHAFGRWSGSWNTLYCAVVMQNNIQLDEPLNADTIGSVEMLTSLQSEVDIFYRQASIETPNWSAELTPRTVIRPYLDAYRMAAQEVFMVDAEPVGINISVSIRIAENYFQSEIRQVVFNTLGNRIGGFFEAGRLRFGQDLYGSDIIESVMALDGVKVVCLNRFKRVGKRYPNQADFGRIKLNGLEIAVCDNNPQEPKRGILRLTLHGGRRG